MKLSFEYYYISCVLLFLVTSAKVTSTGVGVEQEVCNYAVWDGEVCNCTHDDGADNHDDDDDDDDGNGNEIDFDYEDIEDWRYDDLKWSMFDEEQREFLIWREYDQLTWDESLLTWEELPSDRRRIYMSRGLNAQLWNSEDDGQAMRHSTPEAFRPVAIDIDIPALKSLNIKILKEMDIQVRLSDGSDPKPELGVFTGQMNIDEFVEAAESGDADFYLHLEAGMEERHLLQERVGDRVILAVKDSLRNHAGFQSLGVWNDEWETLDEHSYTWGLFLGAKGTKTLLHYDPEVFQFLYVVEGRKRLIMIPNDERTIGLFPATLAEDETAHGDLDVLNTNMPLPKHAIEIELGPGEGIAVPYLCWHAVENLELSLAYSFRIHN